MGYSYLIQWFYHSCQNSKDGTPWQPTKHTRICSAHFINNQKSNDPKSPSYVPTIFPKQYGKKSRPKEVLARYERHQRRQYINSLNSMDLVTAKPPPTASEVDCGIQINIEPPFGVKDVSVVDCGIQVDFDPPFNVHHPNILYSERENTHEIGTQTILNETRNCRCVTPKTRDASCDTQNLNEWVSKQEGFIGFPSIQHDAQAIKDLTGVCINVFMMLLTMIKRPTRTWKLSFENRLLITLMKLKLGITFSSLAVLFAIHRSTASRIFFEVLSELYVGTSPLIFWPSRESIEKTMPSAFRLHFPACRAIIDCTELRMEVPPTTEQQVHFYSNYKSAHTVKFLIACTPNGMISFCSLSYGGRCSDGFITTNSGFLNHVQAGDVILADKGFPQIETVLGENDVILIMPAFSNGSSQFTAEEVERTYSVASVRIHVERCIQRVKCFRILDKVYSELLPHIDKIVQVCCSLSNLKPPLIKN